MHSVVFFDGGCVQGFSASQAHEQYPIAAELCQLCMLGPNGLVDLCKGNARDL